MSEEESHQTDWSSLFGLVIVFGLIYLGYNALFNKKETWQGSYYPQGNTYNSSKYVYSPIFSTLDECRDWGRAEWLKHSEDWSMDPGTLFECSKNCKEDKELGGLKICEETF